MLNVQLIAKTAVDFGLFDLLEDNPHDGIYASDAEVLSEFSGRACYESWGRKNPETQSTDDYLTKNILGKGHESVLEHASASFYVTGLSRAAGYELLRHRHLSRSELSQRYVDMSEAQFVQPPLVRDLMRQLNDDVYSDDELDNHFQSQEVWGVAREAYQDLSEEFDEAETELGRTITKKERREAARAVMPNATETRFVVTGNIRSWRHVVKMRGALEADAEIRQFALAVYDQLSDDSGALWADLERATDSDGREYIREVGHDEVVVEDAA